MVDEKKDQLEGEAQADETSEAKITTEEKMTDKTDKKGMKVPGLDGVRDVGKKVPVGPGNFWNNILSTVLLLIFITAAYSYIADSTVEPDELSISEVVSQVQAGEVKEIIVRGQILEVMYHDEERNAAEAKKETGTAISDTLANFGVTAEQLAQVKIDVQNETGAAYWLSNLAPFLFPLLFLIIIIWFFSRSMRGAGMQAMSFGNSKARMIDPDDSAQKKTFKDVAGAKEAKQ